MKRTHENSGGYPARFLVVLLALAAGYGVAQDDGEPLTMTSVDLVQGTYMDLQENSFTRWSFNFGVRNNTDRVVRGARFKVVGSMPGRGEALFCQVILINEFSMQPKTISPESEAYAMIDGGLDCVEAGLESPEISLELVRKVLPAINDNTLVPDMSFVSLDIYYAP